MLYPLFDAPVWSVPVDWFFTAGEPPRLVGDVLLARCGKAVFGVDVARGERAWVHVLADRVGSESLSALAQDVLVSDYVRRSGRLSTLVAVDATGEERWRVDLPCLLAPRSACLTEGELFLAAVVPESGAALLRFRTPARCGEHTLMRQPWGATRLRPFAGRLLATNPHGAAEGRGLYSVTRDGTDPQVVDGAGALELAAVGDRMAVTSRDGQAHRVSVYDANLRRAWSRPCSNQALAASPECVVTTADSRVVGLDGATGDVRWVADDALDRVSRITITGGFVFVRHARGQVVHALADGSVVAIVPYGWGPPVCAGGVFYATGNRAIACERVSLPSG